MISNKKIIRDKNSIIGYCAYLTENFDRKEGLESFIEDGKLVLEQNSAEFRAECGNEIVNQIKEALLEVGVIRQNKIIELTEMKHLKSTAILIREARKAQRVV